MKFNTLVLFCLFSAASVLNAQETITYLTDPKSSPREKVVDMEHIKIEIEFEVSERKVIGKVEESFTVLRQQVDSLFLDAIDMEFSSIKLNGKNVDFKQKDKGIEIYFTPSLKWNSKHKLTIDYTATPKRGLYFVGWNDTTGASRKQIWTQGQGIDNRHWLPMYDEMNDKLISEMIVHFDDKYKVLSNGKKISEKKSKNNKKTWHYKISKPHAPYLIMLGIGDYAIEERKSKSGVKHHLYYYPEEPETVEPTYRYSIEMFDFFEKEFGVDYPWKVYSQIPVQDFMYGAMENTTATIFGDFFVVDERAYLDKNYVRVNAHELAHQWFGDMVTARSGTHHWLQEGFATHYDLVYQGEAFGDDYFDWARRNYTKLSVEESKKNYKPIAHSQAGNVRFYPKSALVLQMLKDVVGREQFNSVIKYYLEKHEYGNVDSEDFLVAFHEKLGLSLDWFWRQWVYQGGEPSYKIELEEGSDFVEFNVKQVHETNDLVGLFKMPIVFEVHYKDGTKSSQRVVVEEQQQNIRFSKEAGKELDFALFDPDSRVLKSVSFDKSVGMLMAQAEKAEHMMDRYDAIVALDGNDMDKLKPLYLQQFKNEKFHGIRSEILRQLMSANLPEHNDIVVDAINDEDVEVRKSALAYTSTISAELEKEFVKLLSDPSYELIENTLEKLSFDFPQNIDKYLEITKVEKGNRSHNVRVKWLQTAYAHTGNKEYLTELVEYSSPSHEFLTRVNAANALGALNHLDEKALEYLMDANMSFNRRLSGPIEATLDNFYAQHSYKQMIHKYATSQEWNEHELQRVKKYQIR